LVLKFDLSPVCVSSNSPTSSELFICPKMGTVVLPCL
jgi:hypothetical protein